MIPPAADVAVDLYGRPASHHGCAQFQDAARAAVNFCHLGD